MEGLTLESESPVLRQGIPAQTLQFRVLEHYQKDKIRNQKQVRSLAAWKWLTVGVLPLVLRIPTVSYRLTSREWNKENALPKTTFLSVAGPGWEKPPWAWVMGGRGGNRMSSCGRESQWGLIHECVCGASSQTWGQKHSGKPRRLSLRAPTPWELDRPFLLSLFPLIRREKHIHTFPNCLLLRVICPNS